MTRQISATTGLNVSMFRLPQGSHIDSGHCRRTRHIAGFDRPAMTQRGINLQERPSASRLAMPALRSVSS